MRPLGTLLLWLGVLLGTAVGVGVLFGVQIPGASWLVAVGLVKLTLIASGGLMAAGALLQRIATGVAFGVGFGLVRRWPCRAA